MEGNRGIMGCFHSKSVGPRKNVGPDTQPGGTPTPEAESEVHPEIVQLAEVSKFRSLHDEGLEKKNNMLPILSDMSLSLQVYR